MKKVSLWYSFFLGSIGLVIGSAFFPSFPFIVFVPFLVILFASVSYIPALWISALVGLLVDLFSSFPFGLHAIAYTLTTFLLYKQKKVLQEGFFGFFFSLFFIGCIFTALELPLFLIFDKENIGAWNIIDLIKNPFFTALFGLVCIFIPIKMWDIFLLLCKRRRVE
ncbi:MAG: hypothetical protein WCP39_02850 [Chlamydiota bacterium]